MESPDLNVKQHVHSSWHRNPFSLTFFTEKPYSLWSVCTRISPTYVRRTWASTTNTHYERTVTFNFDFIQRPFKRWWNIERTLTLWHWVLLSMCWELHWAIHMSYLTITMQHKEKSQVSERNRDSRTDFAQFRSKTTGHWPPVIDRHRRSLTVSTGHCPVSRPIAEAYQGYAV